MATWQDIEALRASEPALPMAEIARRLDVNSGWVRATFHRKGWQAVRGGYQGLYRRLSDETVAAVLADYKAGMPYTAIGARHGVSFSYVPKLVKTVAPEVFKPRPLGRHKRRMCDADLWGRP